jgi:hypothetical protein
MSDESNRTPMGALESRMVARLFQGIVAAIWVEAPGGLYSFAAPTSPTPEDMADAMICAQLATGLWWNGKARTAADDGGPSGLQHAFAQEIFERRLTPVLARYIKVYRSPSDGFGRDRFHAVVRTAEMVAHSAAETWFTVMGQPRVRPDEAPRSAAVPYDQAAGRVKRVPVEVARDPWFEPQPSVGRVVHYQAYGTPGAGFLGAARCALVTEVHDAERGVISVCVLTPSGLFFNRVSYDRDGRPGTWRWPPFVPPAPMKLDPPTTGT